MKIRADEHVSPEIVETICRVCLDPQWQLDSVHASGDCGTADEHWITRFAKDGGEAILTADADFISKWPQIVAVFRTALKVLYLPPKWGQAPGHLQAAHILLWWPRIEIQLAAMKPRECYRPDWNVSAEAGGFKKMEIDFAKAHSRVKKAGRRNAEGAELRGAGPAE